MPRIRSMRPPASARHRAIYQAKRSVPRHPTALHSCKGLVYGASDQRIEIDQNGNQVAREDKIVSGRVIYARTSNTNGSAAATGNSLKRAKELQQVLFFRRRQVGAEDQVEKLDRIVQRQEPPVVQVGWRVLDAAQGKRLDRPVGASQHAVDHLGLVEALHLQIVHGIVGIVGRRVAGRALPFTKKDFLAAELGRSRFCRVELPVDVELRSRRKVE